MKSENISILFDYCKTDICSSLRYLSTPNLKFNYDIQQENEFCGIKLAQTVCGYSSKKLKTNNCISS